MPKDEKKAPANPVAQIAELKKQLHEGMLLSEENGVLDLKGYRYVVKFKDGSTETLYHDAPIEQITQDWLEGRKDDDVMLKFRGVSSGSGSGAGNYLASTIIGLRYMNDIDVAELAADEGDEDEGEEGEEEGAEENKKTSDVGGFKL